MWSLSSPALSLNNSVQPLRTEPLNLAYHLYRNLNMICHSLISYPRVCSLDMYVPFPGMMQDDKGNIKVNLRIALVQWLLGIYHDISAFCPCTDMALYNRLDKSYTKESPELTDLLDTTKIVKKFLPNQTDIDKLLDVIQGKYWKVHIYQLQLKKSKQDIWLAHISKISICT